MPPNGTTHSIGLFNISSPGQVLPWEALLTMRTLPSVVYDRQNARQYVIYNDEATEEAPPETVY